MTSGHLARRTRLLLSLGLAAAAAACATTAEHHIELAAPVAIDLRLRDAPDAPYRPVTAVTVPASHVIGDGMFPYEGIGWENGFVGYRLYFDGRLVSDIFGKQRPEPALAGIAEFGSYHSLAPWGMDVLKVGPSLGLGGLGIMRDGKPAQFGTIARLAARIEEAGGQRGIFVVEASGVAGADGRLGDLAMRYSIGTDSPLTQVAVRGDPALALTTGVVMHDGAQFLESPADSGGPWRYIATHGAQSENKDNLGMALFYRADQGAYGGLANATHFVRFAAPRFEYAFLAAWERDPGGIRTTEEFRGLLNRELARLQTDSRMHRK